jgi:hypothetical protein
MAALAVSAALLVPLAVFGAPALARSAASQYSGSSQYQYKVAVCHRTHSRKHQWVQISVASAGWLHGHSKHQGDFLVTSTSPCPPTTSGATVTNPSGHGHGHSGHHGQGNSNDGQGNGQGGGNGKGNGHHH